MLDLISALQKYNSSSMMATWWQDLINGFVEGQEYSLEDYAIFCCEQQDIWGQMGLPRHSFLRDIIVKRVPFTTDEVYYAMSAVPNFRMISHNNIRYVAKVDSYFQYKNEYDQELAGVCFFQNMAEVRKYYSEGVNVGEIVLYRLLEFFSSFNTVTDINEKKFLENAYSLANFKLSYNHIWTNVVFKPVTYNDNSNIQISKILHDCLMKFQASWKFLRKFRL